ncbi:puff-specific protein Bx42-like isoform X2 [Daktulosphaira vitifoliae]|uniref:puff-specific protein Bx42-like isoform X2 n=1 Tax=Daktulosphaira vitifoliae TaxID=58002 RepID=UPI0021A98A3B|nr:puff-specific protein Bx42-like isoform X2 [Daktulosphaira vitifoliae]
MSLFSVLPAPSQFQTEEGNDDTNEVLTEKTDLYEIYAVKIPPYGNRMGWVPRSVEDFGDGGAFPEIQIAQFPLNMGKENKETISNALALQMTSDGKAKYDVIARQGHRKDKVIYSKLHDMLPSEILNEDDSSLQKPSLEEVAKLTEKTRAALEKLTNSKISAALPVRAADKPAPVQWFRYTPTEQGKEYNSGSKQRVIRLVEAQKDPMEPPKFQINKKIPRGPPSPPAPLMHSPTRKTSVKEQKEWKIPPCISNWKNSKGYTIPLDKRLAADGRGLQQNHINEKFAKLAEALYIADRKAREAVEMRAQLEKKMAQKEKEKKEEHLRVMAQKAREERAGIRLPGAKNDESRERDQLRMERQKDRARDRNLARNADSRKNKVLRDRDVSEQIALGLPAISRKTETEYDTRLLNSTSGINTGFKDDEEYDVYDKPWQGSSLAHHIYRPTANIDDTYGGDLDKIKTNRFVPNKEFSGTDRDFKTSGRSGPVQFEKHQQEEDPFGLDQFLTQAKHASKRAQPQTDREKRRRKD